MKAFAMALLFCASACGTGLEEGDTMQAICGATACGGLEGQSYDDCMDFHCGGDGNGGGGIGGGGGGYGQGETCAGQQSCRAWCFCSGGLFRVGTVDPATGLCSSRVANVGECSA